MDQWIADILDSPQRVALPIMTYPALPLAGLAVRQVVSDGQAQFACIKALAGRFPLAAALTIMDLSVEAEAFGSPIKFSADEVPTVTARIIDGPDRAQALPIPPIGAGRTAAYLLAASLASAHFSSIPVLAGQIGPFSLVARLLGMTEVMMALMLNPDMVHLLLDKATRFLADYARAFKAVGAGGVIIAEPAAGLLSPEQCQEFSSSYVRRIVEAVQDENFIVILHNCGRTTNLVPSLLSTGARGFHFGNAVQMTDILPQVPEDVLAFGNLDPSGVFRSATPHTVKAKTLELLRQTTGSPNFVLSSGCDIPPGTPLANIDAFYAALGEFNASTERQAAPSAVYA
jgi:uroporphyrinogen decarboxylase